MDVLRKRLLFQANHRGMKEADRILGGFADQHLADLDTDQLMKFDRLLGQIDNDLLVWIANPSSAPGEHGHDVLDMIIAYKNALYTALPKGGVIARFGVGHDGIDKGLATQNGLLCTNTPEVLDQSVAELTMLLISAAARHILPLAENMKSGEWTPRPGTELRGRTLVVIGSGRIGSALAYIASEGFQMKVIRVGRGDDFGTSVQDADFVSLHIPATPENRHFIDRHRLAMLPPHAWLINTARGAVVDEAALYDVLVNEGIAGAAIDVFQTEPYEPQDPARDLRTLSNVILTPHIGSYTPQANHRMAERALQNIRLAEAGDYAAMDLLNPEVVSD